MKSDSHRITAWAGSVLFIFAVSVLTPVNAIAATAKAPKEPAAEAVAPPPPVAAKPAPYDDRLARFAEILGSVHYLRNLCEPGKADEWRSGMQSLLDVETSDEPARRELLTAAFNRGYRAFASVYTQCTASAVTAEERYRNEGATLAAEITARFGN